MATAIKSKLHTYNIVFHPKSKTARAHTVVVAVKAATYEEAVELGKSVLKSPTRWTT